MAPGTGEHGVGRHLIEHPAASPHDGRPAELERHLLLITHWRPLALFAPRGPFQDQGLWPGCDPVVVLAGCRCALLLWYSRQVSQTSTASKIVSAVKPTEKCTAVIR